MNKITDAVCQALPRCVEAVNEWKSRGHTVTFFTSRTEDMRSMTEEWLDGCGFKYDALIMNKPRGGSYVWIDNMDVAYHHMHDPKMWLEEAKVCRRRIVRHMRQVWCM
jgi:hypothetical protein